MPKRIGNTIAPRNPVAKVLATRRGGAHTISRSGQRQDGRRCLEVELENWRDELKFEQDTLAQTDEGSENEPSSVASFWYVNTPKLTVCY